MQAHLCREHITCLEQSDCGNIRRCIQLLLASLQWGLQRIYLACTWHVTVCQHVCSEELEGPERSPSPSPIRRKVRPEHKRHIVLIPVLITATDFIGALAAGKWSLLCAHSMNAWHCFEPMQCHTGHSVNEPQACCLVHTCCYLNCSCLWPCDCCLVMGWTTLYLCCFSFNRIFCSYLCLLVWYGKH